jgi:UDP-3-O-[3-hydroxymyristoyl] N-acetylglucosamine deacetylase
MQATLRRPIRFEGVGVHSGKLARVEVRPAAVDEGIAFVFPDGKRVPATSDRIVDTARATVVGEGADSVSTVEHLLSALFALGVSNADVAVDGPEIPAEDGSAERFADAIAEAGVALQDRERPTLELTQPLSYRSGDRAVVLLPADAFRVRFVADFPPPVGVQYFDGAIEPESYRREIAGARTFGYLHEIEALRARGLALGGTLENALVFAPDGPMQPLRWPNEVVRHKVLDLVGDFSLLGMWPLCEVIAIKSGHELHATVTRDLRRRFARRATPEKVR